MMVNGGWIDHWAVVGMPAFEEAHAEVQDFDFLSSLQASFDKIYGEIYGDDDENFIFVEPDETLLTEANIKVDKMGDTPTPAEVISSAGFEDLKEHPDIVKLLSEKDDLTAKVRDLEAKVADMEKQVGDLNAEKDALSEKVTGFETAEKQSIVDQIASIDKEAKPDELIAMDKATLSTILDTVKRVHTVEASGSDPARPPDVTNTPSDPEKKVTKDDVMNTYAKKVWGLDVGKFLGDISTEHGK
jgi:outer membrane murein-binding lipoprotein Lpp